MSTGKIVVVNYGMGNIHSVVKKVKSITEKVLVSSEKSDILNASKIILPGVGHFGKAMNHLNQLNLIETLNQVILVDKKPILGICLGMQLMTKQSEEGNVEGLGWFDAEVVKFRIKEPYKNKVPHTGWNKISIHKKSNLMMNITDNDEFYFVHSYHVISNSDILNTTNYDHSFVSALERDNIFGVQYHPEKSHDAGQTLLANFIDL